MRDNVLNSFIDTLLKENIEKEKFEQYINIFSRFLGYINPNYKYNGTYLDQYINDFMEVCQMIKKKDEKYHEIATKLNDIDLSFELTIDQVFFANCPLEAKKKYEHYYIGMNKDRIIRKEIGIRMEFEFDEVEYIFSKEYEYFKENKLADRIHEEVKSFMKMKKIKEV